MLCLGVMLSNTLVVSALTTVSGFVSINNSTDVDYKTTEEFMSGIAGKINSSSDYNEILNYDQNQKLEQNSTLNYLIQNNLLSSDLSINYDGVTVNTKVADKFTFRDGKAEISKSDFLMTLGKTIYGVKESRPIVFKTKSTRWHNSSEQVLQLTDYVPSGYEGDDTEFDFRNGDYKVYVSPNVYEMYFKDLVSNGIVSLDEFSDTTFIDTYQSYGSNIGNQKVIPLWDSSLGIYDPLKAITANGYAVVSGTNALGSGFNLTVNGFNVSIEDNSHGWFFDEDLLTMDALKYIEKALRKTEKEMTKAEADIITYKYGVKYINRVPVENRDTIKFLVAKGILNFENEGEFSNLFKPLTSETFQTLIYRVHNKNARFDFSSIQLTDSDNYWLSKGFNETKIDFYIGNAPSIETTVEEWKEVAKTEEPSWSNLFGLIKSREKIIADDNGVDKFGNRNYRVRRIYNLGTHSYTYKGTELSASTEPSGEITEVKVSEGNSNYLEVTFKIKAASTIAATAIVDTNTVSVDKSGVTTVGQVPAIAYAGVDGSDEEDVFIPRSALMNLEGMPILSVNDKYLINKETGAKALLLNDNKKALIGNHIFKLDETVVYGLNGEVYYNLEIIKYLLSEFMLSSLNPSDAYYTKGFPNNEILTDVKNSSTGSTIDNIYVRKLNSRQPSNEDSWSEKYFFDLSQSNSISNYVVYDLAKDIGIENTRMIVEFKYMLPKASELGVSEEFIAKYKDGGLTLNDVYDSFYKAPSDNTLLKWWNQNITFGNALMNYMMGTEEIKYINSGYLMPSITVLTGDGTTEIKINDVDSKLNEFFETKIGLQPSFVNEIKGYSENKLSFLNSYFRYKSGHFVNTGDNTLNGLISERTFSVFIGREGIIDSNKNNTTGYTDYIDYVVTDNNGHVYKRIDMAEYLTGFNANSKTVLLKNREEDYSISEYPIQNGELIQIADTYSQEGSSKLIGIGQRDGNSLVYSLAPQVLYSNGVELFSDKEYSKPIANVLQDIGNGLFGEGGWSLPSWDDWVKVDPRGVLSKHDEKLKKGNYYIGNKYYTVDEDGGEPKETKPRKLKDQEVFMYPAFTLSGLLYTTDRNGVLVKRNNDPRLNVRNVTNVGIVSNIIDSIVFGNEEYYSFNELPNKAKVVIGDNLFIKSEGYLNSDVVKAPSNAPSLEPNTTQLPKALETRVGEHLGNMPIINRGFGGTNGTIIDYIDSYKIGPGQEDSKLSTTLKLSSKGRIVISEGGLNTRNYNSGDSYNTFCYSISLKDGLKFKELGDSGRFYLVPMSTAKVEGNIEDISYFIEDLDFDRYEEMSSGLAATEFKISNRIDEIVQGLLEAFDIQRIEDFKGLVSYLMRVICVWLTGVNLVLTLLRNKVLDDIVYDIKYGSGKNGGGYSVAPKFNIDIYSILTFGLQSADHKVSRVKGIVVSGVLFIIAAFLSIGYFT